MNFKPCRVTYQGHRYQIEANGTVRNITGFILARFDGQPQHSGDKVTILDLKSAEIMTPPEASALIPEERFDVAREVRREASRQRRNRNARERNAAMRFL